MVPNKKLHNLSSVIIHLNLQREDDGQISLSTQGVLYYGGSTVLDFGMNWLQYQLQPDLHPIMDVLPSYPNIVIGTGFSGIWKPQPVDTS